MLAVRKCLSTQLLEQGKVKYSLVELFEIFLDLSQLTQHGLISFTFKFLI